MTPGTIWQRPEGGPFLRLIGSCRHAMTGRPLTVYKLCTGREDVHDDSGDWFAMPRDEFLAGHIQVAVMQEAAGA